MKTLLFSALLALSLPALSVPALAADDAIQAAVANPERTAADRERDARDKPAEIMAFAGVKPGMTVVDLFAAGGYWSELLAGVVGPNGKVLAVNNVPYAAFAKDAIKERFTEGRLKNVERRLVEASHMYLPPKSADLVVIVMSYHDVYWIEEKEGWPQIDSDGFLDSIKRCSSLAASCSSSTTTPRTARARRPRASCTASTRTGRRRASPPAGSCSRNRTTACAIRAISSTRWCTTRRSRVRPIATSIFTR